MIKMMQAVAAVAAVLEARKRINIDTNKTFFGNYDFWMYIAEGPLDTNCDTCMTLDGQDFVGMQLRSMFPDLVVMDEDTIYPNVHQTLWGTETCKCVLRRLDSHALDPSDFTVYQGDNLEPYKPKPKDNDLADYGWNDEL